MNRLISTLALTVLATVVLARPGSSESGVPADLRSLDVPASEDSAFPDVAKDGKGGFFMTWLETLPEGAGHRLRISHRQAGGSWEEPGTVHGGKDFWRNWADFPGLGVFADGSIMAHWLSKSGGSTYDYDIRASISRDSGRTWSPSFLVNTDGGKGEHGFVSFAATEKGMAVVWLDGRETKGSHEGEHPSGSGAMTLRFAEFSSDGQRISESRLDAKVCDCCQTTVVDTPRGLLVAYRDRSETEFRDISFIRPSSNKPTPRLFSNDGWKINACPVNGPALAASGDTVAAVWFTMAGRKARVRAAVSRDGGDAFRKTLNVDAAAPIGRVDAAVLPSGETLVSWLARGVNGIADIKAAWIDVGGALQPPITVASTSMARASGFPRFEVSGNEVVFAWTDLPKASLEAGATVAPPRVRTAVMLLK